MGAKVMCNRRQQPRGLITRRWHHLTVATRQGLLHQPVPGVVIACLGRLFQEHRGAPRLDPNQTQTARKGFILRHCDVFGGHRARQAFALLAAVRHHGFFHTTVDPLLRSIGGADKPLETPQVQHEAYQAHPTGPNLDTHQMQRDDQAMEEGEIGNAVTKRHDRRTRVEAVRVCRPRWPRAAGHSKPRGRLTLGGALRVPSAIRRTPLSTVEALPALVATRMARLLLLHDCSHGSLPLLQPRSW
jgi:hypothetical protein